MTDVQSLRIENGFKLTKVGVLGVAKPVQVRRPGRTTTLTVAFDVFVDLPANQKGSHLSRNIEAIAELVDESVREPVSGLEDLCADLAQALLAKHDYASYAEVHAAGDYFLEKTTPLGRRSLERYRLLAEAHARRENGPQVRRSVGVEVIGMTACPCAMETIQAERRRRDPTAPEGGDGPTITHNQRNITFVQVEVPEDGEIEADDLIAIAEASVSAPTYEFLKRPDEGRLVEEAHGNPKFVEDVVRDVLARLLDRYPTLPDETPVRVRSESEESIHKHNAFAERITTFGELRARYGSRKD
jgi:GTP cyclohydrolase-4